MYSGLDSYLENTEAGAMIFRTSATDRMLISSSGYTSIGSNSPGTTRLRVVNGSSGQEIFKADDGSTAVIRAKVDGTVTFEKGSVGIGTTSPASQLHLYGASGVTGEIRLESSNGKAFAIGSTGTAYGSANNFIPLI